LVESIGIRASRTGPDGNPLAVCEDRSGDTRRSDVRHRRLLQRLLTSLMLVRVARRGLAGVLGPERCCESPRIP
jgi:hypothetical protein